MTIEQTPQINNPARQNGNSGGETIWTRLTAMAAVVGLFTALWIGYSSNETSKAATEMSKANEVRDTRTAAYAGFMGSLAAFDEFVWTNLHSMGSGEGVQALSDEAAFFERAGELQSEIESAYWLAKVVAADEETRKALTTLRTIQGDVLLKFKCMGGVQIDQCPEGVVKTSQEEIRAMLLNSAAPMGAAKLAITAQAETQFAQ